MAKKCTKCGSYSESKINNDSEEHLERHYMMRPKDNISLLFYDKLLNEMCMLRSNLITVRNAVKLEKSVSNEHHLDLVVAFCAYNDESVFSVGVFNSHDFEEIL